jgi:hypothetical protein
LASDNPLRGWPSHHIKAKYTRRGETPGIQNGCRQLRSD